MAKKTEKVGSVRVGRSVRYHRPRNVVFMAPAPVVDWLDDLAHELRTSRGEVVLYLLDMGARASAHVDVAEWRKVVAASRHTDERANADDTTSGKAKRLTDIE